MNTDTERNCPKKKRKRGSHPLLPASQSLLAADPTRCYVLFDSRWHWALSSFLEMFLRLLTPGIEPAPFCKIDSLGSLLYR